MSCHRLRMEPSNKWRPAIFRIRAGFLGRNVRRLFDQERPSAAAYFRGGDGRGHRSCRRSRYDGGERTSCAAGSRLSAGSESYGGAGPRWRSTI